MKTAILLSIPIALSNYLYQAFGDQNWMIATERSWFQFGACFAVGLIIFINDRMDKKMKSQSDIAIESCF